MTKQDGGPDPAQLISIVEASRNKLKAVFDTIADPIVSVTRDGKVESLNMAMAHLAGVHPREMVGLDLAGLLERGRVPHSVRPEVTSAIGKVLEDGRQRYRLLTFSLNGQGTFYHQLTVSPVHDPDGGISHAIVQARDVTEFKRMEQQVRDYSLHLEERVAERTKELVAAQEQLRGEKERLALANLELRRLDKLRHDLTNMVVHDMKGPLAEVMGNLDLMRYESLSEMQEEGLELAAMGADDLLRMIMNLLDIDRLEEGRLKVHRQDILFGDLGREVIGKFRTLIRLKEMEVEVVDRTERTFSGDPDLLQRVVQNLLTNALAHTQEGGRVEIRGEDAEDGVLVSVVDTGEGIPERYRDHIFKKFTQASEGTGPRTSTGLGLTFCKMAVEAHGGRIWYESIEGKGTTFFFNLPAQPEE